MPKQSKVAAEENVAYKKSAQPATYEKETQPTKIEQPSKVAQQVPKVERSLPGLKKSTSITDVLSGKFEESKGKLSTKEQFEAFSEGGEEQPFTEEELEKKWREFADTLSNRPNLQSTLSELPCLKENYKLIMNVDNSIQQDLIDSIRPDLVSFLRRELRNSKISFKIKVTEKVNRKVIYTSTDKFKEMLKKNSDLEVLKKTFGLDFD